MKQLRKITGIGLMLFEPLTVWALNPALSQEEVYIETFDNPDLPGWELIPPVDAPDGILHIGPGGGAHLPYAVQNAEVTVRMRRMSEDGIVEIRYRMSESGSYILRIQAERITLSRESAGQEVVLTDSTLELPAAAWVTLRILLQDGEQVVSIEEIGVALSGVDPDPLAAGGIMFLTAGDMDAQFDDLEVRAGDEPAPEEAASQETPVEGRDAQQPQTELPDFRSLVWGRRTWLLRAALRFVIA